MKVKMHNFLITGCAGFIGSHAVDIFLANGHAVIGVDKLTYAGSLRNIDHHFDNENFQFFHVDICSTEAIKFICQKYKVDCIVNFAAESHVDNSIQGADSFILSNIHGVKSLLEVCKNENIQLCHISTDEVYGSIKEGSFNEDDVLSPQNYYSATKAGAEHLVAAYHNTFGVQYLTVRMSNNYGPRQNNEKFLPTVIKSLQANKKIPLYGDGTNVRDWIYVEDSVRIIYNLVMQAPFNEVYNVSFKDEKRNIDVIKIMLDFFNLRFDEHVSFVEDRLGHDFRYSIANDKILPYIDFEPTSFKNGIEKTIIKSGGL